MKEYFKIKNLIKNQVPEFVKDQHPLFVDFIVAYYEWLSQNEGIFVKSLQENNPNKFVDIDETVEDFFSSFIKAYLHEFPLQLILEEKGGIKLDIRKAIKNIKKFYNSKGTEKSYRFLFRILYNSEIEIYYPKNDVLNLSGGKWTQKSFMRCKKIDGVDEYKLSKNYIYQKENITDPYSKFTARALVNRVKIFTINNIKVVELEIENLEGSFTTGEYIYADIEGSRKRYGKISPILNSIVINDRGEKYKRGDLINFSLLSNENTYGFKPKAFVSRTINFGGIEGKVKEITIEDPGFNSDIYEVDSIIGTLVGASGFSGTSVNSSVYTEKGFYTDNTEQISSNKYIQDSDYYQNYSYVIKTNRVLEEYKDIIKRIVHPAGFKLFGETLVKKCILGTASAFIKISKKNIKRIGNYLPYTFLTYDNLASWFTVDGIPRGYSPTTHDELIICGTANCITGNPFSSGVTAPIVEVSQCLSADIEEGMFPSFNYGYWVTYEHPNRQINTQIFDPVLVYIHPNQLTDFYGSDVSGDGQTLTGWQEWLYSNRNVNIRSAQIQFFQDLYGSADPELAPLIYNSNSQFRKISIESFINDMICDYDCRIRDECFSEIAYSSGRTKLNFENKYITKLGKFDSGAPNQGLLTTDADLIPSVSV
jgi:hypothetical protein